MKPDDKDPKDPVVVAMRPLDQAIRDLCKELELWRGAGIWGARVEGPAGATAPAHTRTDAHIGDVSGRREGDHLPPSLHRLTDALALCHVPRWGIVPMIRTQSVAEHSYRVAWIARALCKMVGIGDERANYVMRAALSHDLDESLTSDIPSTFKQVIRDTPEAGLPTHSVVGEDKNLLISWEQDLLALADVVEAATWVGEYGHGEHASRVHAKLLRKAMEGAVEWDSKDYTYGTPKSRHMALAVEQVVRAIELDAGRGV